MNVHHFVADKLSEVVLMKQQRQMMMIRVLAFLGVSFLAAFSVYSFYRSDIELGTTLAFYSLVGIVTIKMINLQHRFGLAGLSFIIYSLSLYLIFTGGYEGTGIMWVYPLSAIGIFINTFRVGVGLSVLNIVLTSLIFAFGLTQFPYPYHVGFRLVLTLVAMSGMCHIVIYFQSQMDDYILKMDQEGIQELAYIDSLTQLANRASFMSVLSHATRLDENKHTAIIYFDLDNFKAVNDCYGHDVGDNVLYDFAKQTKGIAQQALGERLQKYDIARLGGDEFAIFVRDYESEQEVVDLAEQVVALFYGHHLQSLNNIHVEVGASAGISFNNETMTLSQCLKVADRAMYLAKEVGSGNVNVAKTASEPREEALL